jgi:hypothetical protein
VVVGGDTVRVFRDLVGVGATLAVAAPDTQVAANGRTRWRFVSWSDGQPRLHDLVGSAAGDTVIATLARDFRVAVTVPGGGTVTATPAIDLAGTFVAEGAPVTLVASPATGYVFAGWSGDTSAADVELALPLARPYVLAVRFDSLLAIASAAARPGAVMGAAYADTLRWAGGGPGAIWSVVGGGLPPGLAVDAAGRISGVPGATGTFPFTARVTSGPQVAERGFTLTVGAPALATSAVVTQLLRGTGPLTADALRYLDLLGNRNSGFDVGDFRAWVDATGAVVSGAAAALLSGGRR